MSKSRRTFVVALWVSAAAAAGYFAAFKLGALPVRPAAFAALVALLAVLSIAELGWTAVRAKAGRLRPLAAAARLLVVAGLLCALAGGTANYLFGLQGFVVLLEGEKLPLAAGAALQQFDAGPLADPDEVRLAIALAKVELEPVESGAFKPISILEYRRPGGDPVRLRVGAGEDAQAGTLRFHQGAFGFAPRIVIQREGRTVFDETVPFTTRSEQRRAIGFTGELTVEREQLAVSGEVSLESLDEQMRGHATLLLEVSKAGRLLGRGALTPGSFAELAEGHRVGFTGLKKWSEIDIARRNYPQPVFAGAALMGLGFLLWPIAWYRGRR